MKRILAIISLFYFIVGFGQDLSMSAALEKGLKNNFDIQLITANYEVSKTQNSWGMAGMIPTFSLGINNNTSIQDNTNNPATFFPGVLLIDNLQASLDMNWTVFSGFGIRINKERFDKLQAQTKGNAIVVIESTIYDIIMAYYSAVVQERKLTVLRDLLDYSRRKLDYFQMKSDIGVAPSIDLLEFENQLLNDSTNYLLQQLSYRNALRNLNMTLGEDVEELYELSDSLKVNTPNSTYEDLKNEMVVNNSNLKNQLINIELKELEERSKKAAYYPIIAVGLSTSPSIGYFRLFGDNGFSANTNAWSTGANVSLRYDLFQGWNRKRNSQIAQIQTEIALMENEQFKLQLNHQLRGLFELYQIRNKVEIMALEKVKHAKELWKMGKEKYDLGLINVFNLNDIKLSFQQAKLSYYDRLFEVIQTHYDLMRITGRIAQEYKIADNIQD